MKTIQVRLPDIIHGKVRKLAQSEHISLNQFMMTSVSNEVIRHETSDFFRKAAVNFNLDAFEEVLYAIPDVPADEEECIPQRRVAESQISYGSHQ